MHAFRGQVRRIDRQNGSVAIHHEGIEGLMPAMTMSFEAAELDVYADLEVGDEVEGHLAVDPGKRTRLADLTITRPAVAGTTASISQPPPLLRPGEQVPDFEMTLQDGSRVRLSDLKGQIVVLTWIYTRCPLPDYCPLMDSRFRAVADRLAIHPGRAASIRLISLSFDPEHDTPEVLRRHAALRGARPPLWTFAVADEDQIAAVGPGLGLLFGPNRGELIHSLSTTVIDRDGRLSWLDNGRAWTPQELTTRLLSLAAPPTPPRASP